MKLHLLVAVAAITSVVVGLVPANNTYNVHGDVEISKTHLADGTSPFMGFEYDRTAIGEEFKKFAKKAAISYVLPGLLTRPLERCSRTDGTRHPHRAYGVAASTPRCRLGSGTTLQISNTIANLAKTTGRCLKDAGGLKLKEWPAVNFDVNDDDDCGHALLGFPNGAVFAYFLFHRKEQLGLKTITKVTIIRPESDEGDEFIETTLIFHVEDASTPRPDPPAEPKAFELMDTAIKEDVGHHNTMRTVYV